MSAKRWIVGITGASGICYGTRLVDVILSELPELKIDLIVSDSALRVLQDEENLKISPGPSFVAQLLKRQLGADEAERIQVLANRDIGACVASGSFASSGMVVIPCSMKSLAAIASGFSQNLIDRAADVTIKEGRPLVLVPRESPLSPIHLENMLKLSRISGVKIVPAMPGFYNNPSSVQNLVDTFVMRVIDQMGEVVNIAGRWS